MGFIGLRVIAFKKKEFVWSLRKSLLVILGLTVWFSVNFWLYNLSPMSSNLWAISFFTLFVTALIYYPIFLIRTWIKKGFVSFLKYAAPAFVLIGLSFIENLFRSPKFVFLIARILVVVVGLVSLFILAFYLRPVWYEMKHFHLFGIQNVHPGSFAPESWKKLIEKSDTVKQKYLLLQTGHQSLSLTAAEFLEVLKEIRPLIKEEPTLSTYWEKRDQIEEALRQERRG